MRVFIILTLLSLPLLCVSCKEEVPKITEGVIEFEVTYPYFEGSPITKSFLPDKMVLKFKDDKLMSKVSKASMISTIIIADGKKESLSTGLDFGTEKIVTELTPEDLKYLRSTQPKIEIVYTDETDSIAGLFCKKAIGKYVDSDKPDIEIYYTEQLEIKNGNFFTPFGEINGVLLVYDIEHYGMRMRISATAFHEEKVDDNEFKIKNNFELLKFSQFDRRMNNLFKKLIE